MKVTVLRNDPHVPPGAFVGVAERMGFDIEMVELDAGAPIPGADDVAAVLVLGGEMGAHDTDEYPYLAAEKQFLRDVVERDVPVLGICLGCQLLADSLGGSAYRAAQAEGFVGPLVVSEGDPVVSHFGDGAALTMHWDTWDPPPGATIVARSAMYDQAFRYGSALGVQAHPEVSMEIFRTWMSEPEGEILAKAAGRSSEDFLNDFSKHAEQLAATGDRFFEAWLTEIDGGERL